MPNSWVESDVLHHFAELAAAASGGRPQYIRRADGQRLILISQASLDEACLKAIRAQHPVLPQEEPPPEPPPDNAYAEARGLLGTPRRKT